MGTYTTNYNLFMPTIGEQGWGDLVNSNFTTIDTAMKGLDTRLTTCESTDVAYNTRLETLEAGEFETINCSGTITADSVTANLDTCFGVTSESNMISALDLSYEVNLSSSYSSTSANTFTYVENPISNDVTFTIFAGGYSQAPGRSYLKINDVIVQDTGTLYQGEKTLTYSITLKDGDVIYTYSYSKGSLTCYVRMNSGGYLTRGTLNT